MYGIVSDLMPTLLMLLGVYIVKTACNYIHLSCLLYLIVVVMILKTNFIPTNPFFPGSSQNGCFEKGLLQPVRGEVITVESPSKPITGTQL